MNVLDLRLADIVTPLYVQNETLYCILYNPVDMSVRYAGYDMVNRRIRPLDIPHEAYLPVDARAILYLHLDECRASEDVWGVYLGFDERQPIQRVYEAVIARGDQYQGAQDIEKVLSVCMPAASTLVVSIFQPTDKRQATYAVCSVDLDSGTISQLGEFTYHVTAAACFEDGQHQFLVIGIGTYDVDDQMANWKAAQLRGTEYSRPWDSSITLYRKTIESMDKLAVLAKTSNADAIDSFHHLHGKLYFQHVSFSDSTRTLVTVNPVSGVSSFEALPYEIDARIIAVNGIPYLWLDESSIDVIEREHQIDEQVFDNDAAPMITTGPLEVELCESFPDYADLRDLQGKRRIRFPGELGRPIAVIDDTLITETLGEVHFYDIVNHTVVKRFHGRVSVLEEEKLVVLQAY